MLFAPSEAERSRFFRPPSREHLLADSAELEDQSVFSWFPSVPVLKDSSRTVFCILNTNHEIADALFNLDECDGSDQWRAGDLHRSELSICVEGVDGKEVRDESLPSSQAHDDTAADAELTEVNSSESCAGAMEETEDGEFRDSSDAEFWDTKFWESDSEEWGFEAAELALPRLRGARRTLKTLRRYVRPQRVHPDLVEAPGHLVKRATRALPPAEELEDDVDQQPTPAERWPFEQLRAAFWEKNKAELHHAFGPEAEISRTQLADSVEQRFMRRLHRSGSSPSDAVRLAFHGTKRDNFAPIFRQGFLLPGVPGGVPMANGNAHGRGVYAAVPGAAALSSTFCDTRSMLVCGVIDDDRSISPSGEEASARVLRIGRPAKLPTAPMRRVVAAATKPRMWGNHELHRETGDLRHVGSALVIFNPSCVVPLLQVDSMPRAKLYRSNWAPPQAPAQQADWHEQKMKRELELACWPPAGNPNRSIALRSDQQAAMAEGLPHLIAVRRRRARLKWQQGRHAAREAKFQSLQ